MDSRRLRSGFSSAVLFMFLPFNIQASSSSEDPYIVDATSAPNSSPPLYDYVIVGGGATGCALAATLSSEYSVVVLERGVSPYDQPSCMREEGWPQVLLTGASDPYRSTEGVQNVRARVLGGGTSINAGFWSRAEDKFIQNLGFETARVKSAYEWAESQIVFKPTLGPWQTALAAGFVEAGVTPYNGQTIENVEGTKVGNTIFDSEGLRHSAADLLRSGTSSNLKVYINAVVEKINFRKSKKGKPEASGVTFSDSTGSKKTVGLKPDGEVILSAGALGSPQLLLISGVGPAEDLRNLGIEVVLDVQGVGAKVKDNPMNALLVLSPVLVEDALIQIAGVFEDDELIIEGLCGGNKTVLFPVAGQFTAVPPAYRTESTAQAATAGLESLPPPLESQLNNAGSFFSEIHKPVSSGKLVLASTNINVNPTVTYNYFSHTKDINACIRGGRLLKNILDSQTFAPFKYTTVPFSLTLVNPALKAIPQGGFEGALPLLPDFKNKTESVQWCKNTFSAVWHSHGGCRRGPVLDHKYRVKGIESLRVMDGSTWSSSPGTNPQATCIMLGRYMGLEIVASRK